MTEPADKTGATQLLQGRDVAKAGADYPRAVADLLSRRYALSASPAEFG